MRRHTPNDPSVWSLTQSPSRELRVLVDRDTVSESNVVLGLLLEQEGIHVEQYKDDGPPANAKMSPDGFMPPTAIGWVTVGPPGDADNPMSGRSLHTATETMVSESSLLEMTIGYLSLVLDGAAEVADESALLFAVARELGVDLLVTDRADLLASPLARGEMQIRTASAAIPVVALYLRGTEAGIMAIGPDLTEVVSPASYYFIRATDEYLPLMDAIEDLFRVGGRTTDTQLVQAIRRKLGFALMRRDMVWRLMLQHPTIALLEEVAAEVDSFLLFLTAALDAAARLVESVFDLRTHRTKIGFQRAEWREKLTAEAGVVFDEDHVNVVAAITGLRNFTHRTGTRALPIDTGKHDWKKTTTYVQYEHDEDATADGGWRDPANALWALLTSPFWTPSVDMWRLRDGPDVFITPAPMCDVLVGGGIAVLGVTLDALATALGAVRAPDEGGFRIRPHIRTEQVHTFMAIPGFGDVEFLA